MNFPRRTRLGTIDPEEAAWGNVVPEGLDPDIVRASAFEDLYVREYRAIVSLAFALTGNRWVSEDLAQEAFLAAHTNWERVRRYEDPALWVRRVAMNLSVSAFRRKLAEARALGRIALGRQPPLPELGPEDLAFWDAVRSLPRRQAQVVALHYLEDRTVAEVAETLGMAVGTVKKHLHDGRRALAERLRLTEEEAS